MMMLNLVSNDTPTKLSKLEQVQNGLKNYYDLFGGLIKFKTGLGFYIRTFRMSSLLVGLDLAEELYKFDILDLCDT